MKCLLFANKDELGWKEEAKSLGYKVRVDLLKDGTFLVAVLKSGRDEQIYGLFRRGEDGGGYIANPVNKLTSAKRILESYKTDIKSL